MVEQIAERIRWLVTNSPWIIPWLFKRGRDKYLFMQRSSYDYACRQDNAAEKIVGHFEEHNKWEDYDKYLMMHVDESYKTKIALDFGCGPGRNINRYADRFRCIDGCDISREVLTFASCPVNTQLFVSNGDNTSHEIPTNSYDLVISTITLQHICVYEIRLDILRDIFRVLKPGGRFSAQMGFGMQSPKTVAYYENNYNAWGTNRACDVEIADTYQIQKDLEDVGFDKVSHWLTKVGPGDIHPEWIFFTGLKP